jgi:hypothetical protein
MIMVMVMDALTTRFPLPQAALQAELFRGFFYITRQLVPDEICAFGSTMTIENAKVEDLRVSPSTIRRCSFPWFLLHTPGCPLCEGRKADGASLFSIFIVGTTSSICRDTKMVFRPPHGNAHHSQVSG